MTSPSSSRAELLVQHYHKMIDVQTRHIDRRDQLFVYLLIAVGVAALLTWRPAGAEPLLATFIAQALKVEGNPTIPVGLIQATMLAIVFYFTFNLYHRELSVRRDYAYLEALEREVRAELGLLERSIAFGRETLIYPNTRPWPARTLRWVYPVITAVLLVWFLVGRLWADMRAGTIGPLVVDVLLTILTLAYFCAYMVAPRFSLQDGSVVTRRSDDTAGGASE